MFLRRKLMDLKWLAPDNEFKSTTFPLVPSEITN